MLIQNRNKTLGARITVSFIHTRFYDVCMSRPSTLIIERFWNSVHICPDGCWRWTGNKNSKGYGRVRTHYREGPQISAHRYSYIIHRGTVPEGKYVCHTCDNPSCVNPDHLYAGTHSENMQDMHNRGRAGWQYKANNRHAAKLTPEEVRDACGMRKRGMFCKDIGMEFGVTGACISTATRKAGYG